MTATLHLHFGVNQAFKHFFNLLTGGYKFWFYWMLSIYCYLLWFVFVIVLLQLLTDIIYIYIYIYIYICIFSINILSSRFSCHHCYKTSLKQARREILLGTRLRFGIGTIIIIIIMIYYTFQYNKRYVPSFLFYSPKKHQVYFPLPSEFYIRGCSISNNGFQQDR